MMEKIKKYIPKYILLDTIIYIIIMLTLRAILSNFNLVFRDWVDTMSKIIFILGVTIGIIQVFFKRYTKLTILFFILLVIFSPILMLILCSGPTEHVVERDGKKYVVSVNSFLSVYADYYDYKNFLVYEKKVKIAESYGKGGFAPIENDAEHPVEWVTYYDDDGNITREKDGTLR